MKGMFGIVGLVLALAIAGLLVKKQLASTQRPVPALQVPAAAGAPPMAPVDPNATPQQQSQAIQQQVKQALDAAAQARPMPDDAK